MELYKRSISEVSNITYSVSLADNNVHTDSSEKTHWECFLRSGAVRTCQPRSSPEGEVIRQTDQGEHLRGRFKQIEKIQTETNPSVDISDICGRGGGECCHLPRPARPLPRPGPPPPPQG